MNKFVLRRRQLGQGMTEYIIIVALIAIAAIGVYQAFGGIVRGQTAAAASTLAGNNTGARAKVDEQSTKADNESQKDKSLKTFEK
ncbi:hypothetical protein ACO0KY_15545 [Undibacterium sp. Dicai25W]|uniref:hypothetical protein n=1 Tax=Undibacterium sp. Dicai25W TaxID=3413034 RepID=UPI003BF05D03